MPPKLTPAEQAAKSQEFRQRRIQRAKGIMQALLSQLGPDDLVVDCGANVGAVTRPLAKTGAQVHAFEPDPVAFAALTKATQDFPNVTRHFAAVGIAKGTTTLLRDENFDADPIKATRRSTIVPGGKLINETTAQAVETDMIDFPVQLRDWCDAHGKIAFLKLDIEGAELDILTEMLRHDLFDRINLTVAETHAYKFPHMRAEFQALRKTLHSKYPDTKLWLDWI